MSISYIYVTSTPIFFDPFTMVTIEESESGRVEIVNVSMIEIKVEVRATSLYVSPVGIPTISQTSVEPSLTN